MRRAVRVSRWGSSGSRIYSESGRMASAIMNRVAVALLAMACRRAAR